jgi:lipoprotein-releasing system permease protein
LNLPYFISKRLNRAQRRSFSSTIYRIAVASVSLGLTICILSFLILLGFQNTIVDKIYGIGSHIQVSKYSLNNSLEKLPVNVDADFYRHYRDNPLIAHAQPFANKACLLKTEETVEGVLMKGVDHNFSMDHFGKYLVSGRFINFPETGYANEVVLSTWMADRLLLETGDDVLAYFIQNPPRVRKLEVVGLYETGLEDFDRQLVLSDLALIQRLNNWGDSLVGGFEVFVNRPDNLTEATYQLYDQVDYDLYVEDVRSIYLQIFDWLGLLERNVYIFLGLILFVASFNMVSILLILIMDRTPMIGLFKALGATDQTVRKVFMFNGMLIIIRGMIFGNLLALGLCALQYYLKIIPLDPENYYMNYVPVEWNWQAILIINLATFVLVTTVLLIPTMVIARVDPVKSMKFS